MHQYISTINSVTFKYLGLWIANIAPNKMAWWIQANDMDQAKAITYIKTLVKPLVQLNSPDFILYWLLQVDNFINKRLVTSL